MNLEIDARLAEEAVRRALASRTRQAPADLPAGAPAEPVSGASGRERRERNPAQRLPETLPPRAASQRRREADYHVERERLYALKDPEAREQGFAELHLRWFVLLGLDRPLLEALDEFPDVLRALERCVVSPAARAPDEGVELYVSPRSKARHLGIRLLPQSLLDPAAMRPMLRAELTHVHDMLDPRFGYEPALPPSQAGPTHDRLLLDRYAALWSASVWGRAARGPAERDAAHDRCLRRFVAAFPMLASGAEALFARFFDGPRPSHHELVHFALEPRQSAGLGSGLDPGTRCGLCGFPSYVLLLPGSELPEVDAAALQAEFPAWRPERGLCLQCLDLLRVRPRTAWPALAAE
jgi:hypothetical protein